MHKVQMLARSRVCLAHGTLSQTCTCLYVWQENSHILAPSSAVMWIASASHCASLLSFYSCLKLPLLCHHDLEPLNIMPTKYGPKSFSLSTSTAETQTAQFDSPLSTSSGFTYPSELSRVGLRVAQLLAQLELPLL